MATLILLMITGAPDETYAPTQIGRGLWRSPAGFVYRSDKRFTGDELKRQEIAAGFDVGSVPPRSPQEIKLAFGVDQPSAVPARPRHPKSSCAGRSQSVTSLRRTGSFRQEEVLLNASKRRLTRYRIRGIQDAHSLKCPAGLRP
jgi:hypothetical protein